MANVQHSALTGSDLHECKGAASAAPGQVPVANGSGSAPFAQLSYTQLSNRPNTIQFQEGTSVITGAKMATFKVQCTAGVWNVALSGFTTIYSAQATCTDGAEIAVAAITTISPTSITGKVATLDTTAGTVALGTSQYVYVVVWGL